MSKGYEDLNLITSYKTLINFEILGKIIQFEFGRKP